MACVNSQMRLGINQQENPPHPQNTVGGQNPAPPKKPWNDDSPVNTSKLWVPMLQSGAGFRPSTVWC